MDDERDEDCVVKGTRIILGGPYGTELQKRDQKEKRILWKEGKVYVPQVLPQVH